MTENEYAAYQQMKMLLACCFLTQAHQTVAAAD